jgi:hypothetical protein
MNSEECRRWAQRCLARARDLDNCSGRIAMIELAMIWLRIAERAEQQQQIRPAEEKWAAPIAVGQPFA